MSLKPSLAKSHAAANPSSTKAAISINPNISSINYLIKRQPRKDQLLL